jgi:hypothetical protein
VKAVLIAEPHQVSMERTHRFPLDSYTTAIDTFRKGTGLKVQVTPNGSSV